MPGVIASTRSGIGSSCLAIASTQVFFFWFWLKCKKKWMPWNLLDFARKGLYLILFLLVFFNSAPQVPPNAIYCLQNQFPLQFKHIFHRDKIFWKSTSLKFPQGKKIIIFLPYRVRKNTALHLHQTAIPIKPTVGGSISGMQSKRTENDTRKHKISSPPLARWEGGSRRTEFFQNT